MKRLIFTLLYAEKHFFLSRNFRLQKVGDIDWLFQNYDFINLTNYIDELIILNISKKKIESDFLKAIKNISKKTFIPIGTGGGIEKLEDVQKLLDSGSDKIVINNMFFERPKFCENIASKFGKQFLIGSIDYSYHNNQIFIHQEKRNKKFKKNLNSWIDFLSNNGAGEVILQSIDRDGTGFGLHKEILQKINKKKFPIILMGGVGKFKHIEEGFSLKNCDAISTANLFNFIGNEFADVRNKLEKKFNLPKKGKNNIKLLKNFFNYG